MPLNKLSEEEDLFRESVADFAVQDIRPHVRSMDEQEKIDSELIDKFFQLGLMGIEIPRSLGGAESNFFMSIVAVEELSRVDASVGVRVDVQNPLVNTAILRWGSQDHPMSFGPETPRS